MGGHRGLLAQLTFSGVFERHPNLKVVFTKGGANWAAHAITDIDDIYQNYNNQLDPQLPIQIFLDMVDLSLRTKGRLQVMTDEGAVRLAAA